MQPGEIVFRQSYFFHFIAVMCECVCVRLSEYASIRFEPNALIVG